MAMTIAKIGLQMRINADPQRPSAEQDYVIRGIEEGETENDVVVKLLNSADWSTSFFVPNEESTTPLMRVVFAIKSAVINVQFRNKVIATATVVYRPPSIPLAPSAGGKDPNQAANESSTGDEQVLGPEYSFDTQGSTLHILKSEDTRYRKMADGTDAPFLKNLIGLSRDKVEGVDVVGSTHKWSVTLKNCNVTRIYERNAARLTGTINSERFFTYERGEVLFLGMTGNYTPGDGWVCSWFFESRENERSSGENGSDAGVTLIPGGSTAPVTVPEKMGHDYVWFIYSEEPEPLGNFLIQVPAAAYVERVYKFDNQKLKLARVGGLISDIGNESLKLSYLFSAI
jgi:hypothetical protein